MRRLVSLGMIALILTWSAVALAAVSWPRDRALTPADVIICLGAAQRADGTAGPASRGRAISCDALFAQGLAPLVLFSGAGAEERSVAQAMWEETTISTDHALIEGQSRSTLQNAAFSLEMLPDDASLIVLSDAFHLPRVWVSFRLMGADAQRLQMAPAQSGGLPRPRDILREGLAIWFNLARATAWSVANTLAPTDDARLDWLR